MGSVDAVWAPHATVSMVMGSLGAGVSTSAAVLAVTAALQGRDVLLVLTDDSPAAEILLGGRATDDRDHVVFEDHGRVRVTRVSAQRVFSVRLGHGGLGGVFRRALSGSSLPLIAAAVPGLNDLLTLTGILEREKKGDAIVVDCPGGGRSLRFLHAVEDASDMLQSPHLLESAVDVQAAFEDPERFEAVPVLLPEYDDARAARSLVEQVRTRKAMSVRHLVANRVLPDGAVVRGKQRAIVSTLERELGVEALHLPRLDGGVVAAGDVFELAESLAVR